MDRLYKDSKSDKPKYGLFKTIKLYTNWIRTNLYFFLLIIFAGLLLGYLIKLIITANNPISVILSLFFANVIQLGIITMFISKYKAEKKIDLITITRVLLIMLILTIFTYLVLVFKSLVLGIPEFVLPIISFQYLGYVICTLAIYNIFSCETHLGLKFSLSWLLDNILFYLKLFVLYILIHIVIPVGVHSVISSIMELNQTSKVISAIGLVMRSALMPLSYFYVIGKQSKTTNYEI